MKTLDKSWLAYYEPAGHKSWTKRFTTKKGAEKYVISRCCGLCKKEGLFSMCGSEWLVIPYNKYLKSENHGDLMNAAGWKRIKKYAKA